MQLPAEPIGSIPRPLRLIEAAAATGGTDPALDPLSEEAVARDGTERPIGDSAAPIRDEAGTQAGAILVFRDATERQSAEAAGR